MPDWLTIALLTLMAGITMPLGAWIANFERVRPRWLDHELRHAVIAFGGGTLLAAVALVLVPGGMEHVNVWWVIIMFALGGVVFFGFDVALSTIDTPASQFVAMLADFVPESIALGATFVEPGAGGPLLAILIALQNLPEGFNSFRELKGSARFSARRVIMSFAALALLGPAAALAGFFWLRPFPEAVSFLMLFAAGGIMYIIFQDIAPQAKLDRHWAPPLGAVAGFLLGMIGHALLG